MELTTDQLQTLRHMLGIDKPDERAPEPYRDHYCASRGDADKVAEKIRETLGYRPSVVIR